MLFEQVKAIFEGQVPSKGPLSLHSSYKDILNEIGNETTRAASKTNSNIALAKKLRAIWLAFSGRDKSHQNICNDAIEKLNTRLRMAASFKMYYKNCEQLRADISIEITFLELLCNVIVKASMEFFNDTGKKLLNKAFELVNNYGGASESVRMGFKVIVQCAIDESNTIGISLEEKRMVLRAIDFQPECGKTIKSTQHCLAKGNAFDPDMDGAAGPSWPGPMF